MSTKVCILLSSLLLSCAYTPPNPVSFTPSSLTVLTRPDFPILNLVAEEDEEDGKSAKPLVYLDSAASSQKPSFVINAMSSFDSTTHSNVHRGAHRLSREATRLYEEARDKLVRLINAK